MYKCIFHIAVAALITLSSCVSVKDANNLCYGSCDSLQVVDSVAIVGFIDSVYERYPFDADGLNDMQQMIISINDGQILQATATNYYENVKDELVSVLDDDTMYVILGAFKYKNVFVVCIGDSMPDYFQKINKSINLYSIDNNSFKKFSHKYMLHYISYSYGCDGILGNGFDCLAQDYIPFRQRCVYRLKQKRKEYRLSKLIRSKK